MRPAGGGAAQDPNLGDEKTLQEFYHPGDPVADILFNWLPLIGAAALLSVGLFLIFKGYYHYLNSVYLKRSGQVGRARVTAKWIKKGYVDRKERHRKPALKRYFLRFELLDDRRAFSVKQVAPVDLWNRSEPGDTVEVIYHPRLRLMHLTAWSSYSGTNGGAMQMTIGAVLLSSAIATLAVGAFEAFMGPEERQAGADWRRDKAEVLNVGTPADPFLRIFAPGSKMVRVVFGETHGGAFTANQRIIWVSASDITALDIEQGKILAARIDPEDEYNAILDLEIPLGGLE